LPVSGRDGFKNILQIHYFSITFVWLNDPWGGDTSSLDSSEIAGYSSCVEKKEAGPKFKTDSSDRRETCGARR
jgi:hypothetical protein